MLFHADGGLAVCGRTDLGGETDLGSVIALGGGLVTLVTEDELPAPHRGCVAVSGREDATIWVPAPGDGVSGAPDGPAEEGGTVSTGVAGRS